MKKGTIVFRVLASGVLILAVVLMCVLLYPVQMFRFTKAFPRITTVPLESAFFYRIYYTSLDKTIYDQLNKLGLLQHRVVAHDTSQKNGSILWPQKYIEVSVPERVTKSQIIDAFQKAFLPFQPLVSYVISAGISPSEFTITVSASTVLTHKLNFFSQLLVQPEIRPKARVAIIIDDLGYNYQASLQVISIKAPLTLAILPFYTFSRAVAEKAHAMGHEILLHVPMEPKNGTTNNGNHNTPQDVLSVSMNNLSIINQVIKSIDAVPYIVGVNNHMGSRFTEDGHRMRVVFEQLRQRGLFFIDSLTSQNSAGCKLAKQMGIKTAARDVFLDNEESYLATVNQLEKLAMLALTRGTAVGIGHPHPSTIDALNTMIPAMVKRGVQIVPVSRLIE